MKSILDKLELYYPEHKVFYSVIPSKSYFINDSLKTPFDYEKMLGIMSSKIKSAEYIDVFNTLSLTDYYVTDPHFKQDKISAFINELSEKDRRLIELRYFMSKTQTEVAGKLGMSQVQVSRIEKNILNNMKKQLMLK